MTEDRPLLIMTGIVKEFPGVRALDEACFELRAGEVHALVGENGAGKSTLMNVLNGVVLADAGTTIINGRTCAISNPRHAQRLGIAFIHQEPNLIDCLSVGENFFLGREPINKKGLVDWDEIRRRASALLVELEVGVSPDCETAHLSAAEKQMVEIAKALAHEACIIVMDEPTSSLTESETRKLFNLITRLKAEGKGIIYISHRMEEIFEIADRATVMRSGKYIGTVNTSESDYDEIVRMMVGQDPASRHCREGAPKGPEVLSVAGLSGRGRVHDITLSVYSGQIVGIAGLMGSGRTELLESIYGVHKIVEGHMTFGGARFSPSYPGEAIRRGVAYVPEDRDSKGLFLNFDVLQNMQVSKVETQATRGIVRAKGYADAVQAIATSLGIVTPSINQLMRNLSGGNKQKSVLGKCVLADARLLLVNEPTRGIDVAAKAEVYRILYQLCKQGVGILLVSSDLVELMELSDQILVMSDGRIVASFDRGQASKEQILHAMMGHVANGSCKAGVADA